MRAARWTPAEVGQEPVPEAPKAASRARDKSRRGTGKPKVKPKEVKLPAEPRLGGPPLHHNGGSWGVQNGGGAKLADTPGLVERMLEKWLLTAKPGQRFCYFRGEVGREKQTDPYLARLCERLLHLAVGRFDVLSACGHVRGEIIGAGEVVITSTRVRGEQVHLVIKR